MAKKKNDLLDILSQQFGNSSQSAFEVVSTLSPGQHQLMNRLLQGLDGQNAGFGQGLVQGGQGSRRIQGSEAFGGNIAGGGSFQTRDPRGALSPGIQRSLTFRGGANGGGVQAFAQPGDPRIARSSLQNQLDSQIESRQGIDNLITPGSIEDFFERGVAAPARRQFDQTVRPRISEAFARAGLSKSVGAGTQIAKAASDMAQGLSEQLGRIQINLRSQQLQLAQRERESQRGAAIGVLGQSQIAFVEGGLEGDFKGSTKKKDRESFSERFNTDAKIKRAAQQRGKDRRSRERDKRKAERDEFARSKRAKEERDKKEKVEPEKVKEKSSVKNKRDLVKKKKSALRSRIAAMRERVRNSTDRSFKKRLTNQIINLRDELNAL